MILSAFALIATAFLFLIHGLFSLVQFVIFDNVETVILKIVLLLLPWGGYINLTALYAVLAVVINFVIAWFLFTKVFWPVIKLAMTVMLGLKIFGFLKGKITG